MKRTILAAITLLLAPSAFGRLIIKTFNSDCKNNHNSRIFPIFVPIF